MITFNKQEINFIPEVNYLSGFLLKNFEVHQRFKDEIIKLNHPDACAQSMHFGRIPLPNPTPPILVKYMVGIWLIEGEFKVRMLELSIFDSEEEYNSTRMDAEKNLERIK